MRRKLLLIAAIIAAAMGAAAAVPCDINMDGTVDVGDVNAVLERILNGDSADAPAVTIDDTTPLGDKHRVIYEMNVGSFTAAGTLQAAQERLSELRTLGVDIVWLMPIYPRGGGINSPYAATDFKAVNPKYGTVSDLKNFVTHAHSLGMQVWLDWVPNHTATNARWVTEHPEYYVKNGTSIVHPNNYSDVYQLNYNNADLCDAMNDCLKYWIDEADVDGYRCDYISSTAIPTSYWQSAIPLIKGHKAGKTVWFLGETDIVQDVKRLLNAGFDYDYAWNFQGQLAAFGPNGSSGENLRSRCAGFINASKTATVSRMVYLNNHDVNYNDGGKSLTDLYGNNRYALTTLMFTIYGMPLLYNGQEIGCNQKLDYFNDSKVNWNTVDSKMKNTVRTLASLRHTQAALADDVVPTFHTVSTNSVLAFTKAAGASTVLVVLNMGQNTVDVTLGGVTPGDYVKWLDSSTVSAGVVTTVETTTLSATPTLRLEGKGYRVMVMGGNSRYDVNRDGAVDVGDVNNVLDYILNNPGGAVPDPQPAGHKMYVHSELGWSAYAMYVWSSTTNSDVEAAWPGVTPSGTTTIAGTEWMVFDMSEAYSRGSDTNWIINNNNGGEQYDLMTNYNFSSDTYVRVSASGSYTVSPTP
ncbi:MAG: hypothetical protein IJU62_01775 [Muribaculaceae bacterium]|nr:hypothetical protein [Muribaculaceae bacterium]